MSPIQDPVYPCCGAYAGGPHRAACTGYTNRVVEFRPASPVGSSVPGDTETISDEAVQAFADAAATYMFERGILNPEDVRDGLRAARPLLVSAEAETGPFALLVQENARLRAELAERDARLHAITAAAHVAWAGPTTSNADALRATAEAVEANRLPGRNYREAAGRTLRAVAAHLDGAVLRAAGGQEKPTDERARVLAILADKCNHCGIRSSDFTEDGHCVDCMTLLDALVSAAPAGGQAEPSDAQALADAQSWAPEGEPTEAAARTLYRQHLRHWEHDWDETSEAQRTVYRGMAGDILRAAAAVSGEQAAP